MATNAEAAYERLKTTEGTDEGTGEWFEVTQEQVDGFADLTHDHQFIHVDPERAAPIFGGTIAHGFLTLSMLTHLAGSIRPTGDGGGPMEGLMMGMNYGFDKVRFVSPVKVGSRIRASSTVKAVELKGSSIQVTKTYTIEVDGEERPAVVADWLTRLMFS
ncbi:MAG: MaoC family dehydratase [Acidimicrobiales bacterium]